MYDLEKVVLNVSMDVLANQVDRWIRSGFIGKYPSKKTDTAAVWLVGNCIIGASALGHDKTELILILAHRTSGGKYVPDDPARKDWNHLGQLWIKAGWISDFRPIGSAHLASPQRIEDKTPGEVAEEYLAAALTSHGAKQIVQGVDSDGNDSLQTAAAIESGSGQMTKVAIADTAASGAVRRQSEQVSQAEPTRTNQSNKRGKRSRYTLDEKDEIVKAWEETDKDSDSQNLEDFLVERFGGNEKTLKPFVSPSAFYSWRANFYKRNPNWSPEKDNSKRKKRRAIK